jgi:16S rRNA (cytosine1402-N4)-methyltransferase
MTGAVQGNSVVHDPVLASTVVGILSQAGGALFVDGTVGAGGHAAAILEMIPDARVIGIDRDPEILQAAGERLEPYGSRATLCRGNYRDMPQILAGLGLGKVDGVLLDLGLSSLQVDRAQRGFSYGTPDAPLDMRMDPGQSLTAAGLLNRLDERELARIIEEYGEERWATRIAKFVVRSRARRPIETAGELVETIQDAIPASARRKGGHPARRTFQALRIAVNDELGALEDALLKAPDLLNPAGRMVVIAFHSLEDRMVKRRFQQLHKEGGFELLGRKPVTPSDGEVARNPRARSAKLRAIARSGPVLGPRGGE